MKLKGKSRACKEAIVCARVFLFLRWIARPAIFLLYDIF